MGTAVKFGNLMWTRTRHASCGSLTKTIALWQTHQKSALGEQFCSGGWARLAHNPSHILELWIVRHQKVASVSNTSSPKKLVTGLDQHKSTISSQTQHHWSWQYPTILMFITLSTLHCLGCQLHDQQCHFPGEMHLF